MDISTETYIFLASVLAGFIVGLIFDMFRIQRMFIKPNRFITSVQDIVFWILVALVIFVFIFTTNSGELRWFEFLGIILGVLLYKLLLSKYVIKLLVGLIYLIKRIIGTAIKIILLPFKIIYKIFRGPVMFFGGIAKKIYKKQKLRLHYAVKNVKIIFRKI